MGQLLCLIMIAGGFIVLGVITTYGCSPRVGALCRRR
jgi:hypothetical protein